MQVCSSASSQVMGLYPSYGKPLPLVLDFHCELGKMLATLCRFLYKNCNCTFYFKWLLSLLLTNEILAFPVKIYLHQELTILNFGKIYSWEAFTNGNWYETTILIFSYELRQKLNFLFFFISHVQAFISTPGTGVYMHSSHLDGEIHRQALKGIRGLLSGPLLLLGEPITW